jgi:hypothetical protein
MGFPSSTVPKMMIGFGDSSTPQEETVLAASVQRIDVI